MKLKIIIGGLCIVIANGLIYTSEPSLELRQPDVQEIQQEQSDAAHAQRIAPSRSPRTSMEQEFMDEPSTQQSSASQAPRPRAEVARPTMRSTRPALQPIAESKEQMENRIMPRTRTLRDTEVSRENNPTTARRMRNFRNLETIEEKVKMLPQDELVQKPISRHEKTLQNNLINAIERVNFDQVQKNLQDGAQVTEQVFNIAKERAQNIQKQGTDDKKMQEAFRILHYIHQVEVQGPAAIVPSSNNSAGQMPGTTQGRLNPVSSESMKK